MSKQTPELLSCPFCGNAMTSFAGLHPDAYAKGADGTFSVNCDCGAMGPFAPSMAEAINAWNRRELRKLP